MTFRFPARPPTLAISVVIATAALTIAGAANAPAGAAPTADTGWRVIRTIGPRVVGLRTIVTFHRGAPWMGGATFSPKLQSRAFVSQLVSGSLHRTWLTTQLGTAVNALSATTPTNVWASLTGVPGGQVDRLTSHGWHPYSFAIGTHSILVAPVVTLGPKDTWVFTADFNTQTAYGYHFDGSTWSRHVLPAFPQGLLGAGGIGCVSASASNNIWSLIYLPGQEPASMWYNGSRWRIASFPAGLAPSGTALNNRQILALSPTNVWATISTPTTAGVGPLVLLHWNGHNWKKITGRLPKASLVGPIASDGSGGLWLSGVNSSDTVALMMHFAHGRWSTFMAPVYKGMGLYIWQLALVPGTHSVLGVADIPNSAGPQGAAVIKFGP